MEKIKVGIIFGGRSREREISFAGGRTVYDNLDKTLFEPVPLFADSFGNLLLIDWQYIYKGSIRDFYPPTSQIPLPERSFLPYADSLGQGNTQQQKQISEALGKIIPFDELRQYIDFAFLTLHGTYGEDGTIQGILQYFDIPYTASGILPSALGMDKSFQKRLLTAGGFHVPEYQSVSRFRWITMGETKRRQWFEQCKLAWGLPFIIKPANQGSSIGVGKLTVDSFSTFKTLVYNAFFIQKITQKDWQSYEDDQRADFIKELIDVRSGIGMPLAIGKQVFYLPSKLLRHLNYHFAQPNASELLLESLDREAEVLVEKCMEGKEFSCIVIQNENGKAVALPPTEIRKGNEVYDYRSKYLAGLSSKQTPIDLSVPNINLIRNECERLFKFFGFHTYARLDGFFKTGSDPICLNDPNTTSGMLPSSFFFHQAAEIGLTPSQFLTFIVRSSLNDRHAQSGYSMQTGLLLEKLDTALSKQQSVLQPKLRVGVILGGYSSERHISVESGRNVFEKLSSSGKYTPIPIFLLGDESEYGLYEIPISMLLKDNADDIAEKIINYHQHPIVLEVQTACKDVSSKYAGNSTVSEPRLIPMKDLYDEIDIAFIALHGRPGEDGALQQQLERLKIPYNGSGVASSAITIDKYATNQLLKQHGFKVAQQFLVQKEAWKSDPAALFQEIEHLFSYPLIAKPKDDGCSSAVKKINNSQELAAYTKLIFRDISNKIDPSAAQILRLKPREEFPSKQCFLVEELIEKGNAMHFLEVTVGLLTRRKSNGAVEYEMFEPSETLASDEVLSLEEKFLAGQGQNITPARFDTNPQRNQQIAQTVKQTLERAARLLRIEGYSRIDAFVKIYNTHTDVYIIEANSLPGMTPATCIFHQCALNGYTPINFIDHILNYGMDRTIEW